MDGLRVFEIEPRYLGATQARKLVGIKVPRGEKAKKVVMEHLLATDPDFTIERTHKETPSHKNLTEPTPLLFARAGLKDLAAE